MSEQLIYHAETQEIRHPADVTGDIEPFTLEEDTNDDFDVEDTGNEPQPEAAAPNTVKSAKEWREDHEAKEAARRAEWEARQAAKKQAEEHAMHKLQAMSDEAVVGESVTRLGRDAERLTRRNMKMCVTEYVQTLCYDNPAFARHAMNPRKNMMNCFKYITRYALNFIKQELEDNCEPSLGFGMGSDVPDDLCYQWAEDYFRDLDAEEDKDKDEQFVPKPFYGSSSIKTTKKAANKAAAKLEEKSKEEKTPIDSGQISLMTQMSLGEAAVENAEGN